MPPTRFAAAALAILALPLLACDPGSRSTIEPVGTDRCHVALTSRDDGFTLDMQLRCAGPDHTRCYAIGELQCGGKDVTLAAPLAIGGCPGGEHCVDDCKAVEAPGTIWDTPAIREQPGCDVYAKR